MLIAITLNFLSRVGLHVYSFYHSLERTSHSSCIHMQESVTLELCTMLFSYIGTLYAKERKKYMYNLKFLTLFE